MNSIGEGGRIEGSNVNINGMLTFLIFELLV